MPEKIITLSNLALFKQQLDNVLDDLATAECLTISGATTLTGSDLDYVKQDNARIKYNNAFYEKVNDNGTTITFANANLTFGLVSGSSTLDKGLEIYVNKTSGALTIGTAKTLQTYNKTQADALFGHSLELSINTTTYVVTATLKDNNGNALSTQTIDLPLESVVVNGSYDSTNKKIVLTLQNGSTVDIPVADLVAGLVSTSDLANYYTKTQIDGLLDNYVEILYIPYNTTFQTIGETYLNRTVVFKEFNQANAYYYIAQFKGPTPLNLIEFEIESLVDAARYVGAIYSNNFANVTLADVMNSNSAYYKPYVTAERMTQELELYPTAPGNFDATESVQSNPHINTATVTSTGATLTFNNYIFPLHFTLDTRKFNYLGGKYVSSNNSDTVTFTIASNKVTITVVGNFSGNLQPQLTGLVYCQFAGDVVPANLDITTTDDEIYSLFSE